MKRLIRLSEDESFQVGDNVQWKRHPYDNSVYEVTEVLPDGSCFIDNGINAYTNINPKSLKMVNLS